MSLATEIQYYTEAVEEIFDEYPEIIVVLCGLDGDGTNYRRAYDRYVATHDEIQLQYGASKIVLVSDDCQYVCKMPRFGDECSREVEIYQKAVEAHLEKYFAPCFKVGECHGMPLYFMEKVDAGVEVSDWVYLDDIPSYEYDDMEVTWTAICENWNEDCAQLKEFLDQNDVNDIHDENIGYDGDRIVIIDYSGYNGRNRSSSDYKKNIWFTKGERK